MACNGSYSEVEEAKRVPHARVRRRRHRRAVAWHGEATMSCREQTRRFLYRRYLPFLHPLSLQTTHQSSPCRVALLHPRPEPLRTEIGRTGLRNPTSCIKTPTRMSRQSGFWRASSTTSRFRYLGSARLTTSWRTSARSTSWR